MIIFIILVFNITICYCANILAILPLASTSHGIWANSILKELNNRGHNITALSVNVGESRNNLTYINIEKTREGVDFFPYTKFNSFESGYVSYKWMFSNCITQLKSHGVKQLLKLKQNYDLIIFDSVGNDCFYGLLHYFDAPTVAISAYGCYSWSCTTLGGYYPLSVYPDQYLSYLDGQMTLFQRIHNILLISFLNIFRYFVIQPMSYDINKSLFGENLPSLQEIQDKYFKIMLINSGPAGIDANVVLSTAIVEVGCVHCRPARSLSKDIKEYLDNATDGAIFFSLGSNVRSDTIKPEILNAILKTFSKLPYMVLWKFESGNLENRPDNVKIGKWLPQQDILGHPNIKLFISHGGKLSCQESMYHGVPLLVIPILVDQYANANRIKSIGIGEIIKYNDINEKYFTELITKLLNDLTYKNKAKEASILMQDQPQTPLERAIFWIEYVIRHGHKTNLKASTTKLPWYQLLYLDIIAFVLVICFAIRFLIKQIFVINSYKKIKSH